MRNNTIEIKLNSYGTLEVVTIPVKLYKDSYNVVKLRVNAPETDNSMLKVYLSDRDEAGEQVWTSDSYNLEYKGKTAINGVAYNVYEDMLPQEFCSEEGDIYLTFAQVVGSGDAKQVITSGTLNLYVSGEGFNYNGVKLSVQDDLAVKINEIYKDHKDYDLKIYTQDDFEAFYTSLDNNTCNAKSVLLVGDGGTTEFVRNDGKGLVLPATLLFLDGINNAILRIDNIEQNGSAVTWSIQSSDRRYRLSNINIKGTTESSFVSGILRATNIYNCIVDIDGAYKLFLTCENIYDCYARFGSYSDEKYREGYAGCKNLVNCECYTASNSAYQLVGYNNCERLVNCEGKGNFNVTFSACKDVVNCVSSGSFVNQDYNGCNRLVNCQANKYYAYCHYLTNCVGGTKQECTFVSATQEDIDATKQYIDSKIGEVNTALTDLNSGEGV